MPPLPPPPLCFVERQPFQGSPAAIAGLQAGDAILRFGEAEDLSQLPSWVKTNVRVAVKVMDREGVVTNRVVIPRPFDPKRPQSLLGCMLVDKCPAAFMPHPALRWQNAQQPKVLPKRYATTKHTGVRKANLRANPSTVVGSVKFLRHAHLLPRWHDDDNMSEIGWEEHGRPSEDDSSSMQQQIPNARSNLQTLAEDGSQSEDGSDAHEEQATLRSDARNSHPHAHSAPICSYKGTSTDNRSGDTCDDWRCHTCDLARQGVDRCPSRAALFVASLLNLVHGFAFVGAPSLGSTVTVVLEDFPSELWKLATSDCSEALRGSGGLSMRRALSGSATLVTFDAFVKVAIAVASLQALLAIGGFWLALTPSSGGYRCCCYRCRRCCHRMRLALVVLYPPAALLLWLLLAAATMYCLAFRWEADELLKGYWECLKIDSAGAAANGRYFELVAVATVVCASADLSAVFALFASCSLIGWRSVLRTSVMTFAGFSTLCGATIVTIGALGLRSRTLATEFLPATTSKVLLCLGAITLAVGLLGYVAAKGERRALLQIYALLLVLSSAGLMTLCVVLWTTGLATLQPWIVSLGASGHTVDASASSALEVDAIVGMMQDNHIQLSVVSVLVLFLLVVNGTMACSLRVILSSAAAAANGEYERVLSGNSRPDPNREDSDDGEAVDEDEEAASYSRQASTQGRFASGKPKGVRVVKRNVRDKMSGK